MACCIKIQIVGFDCSGESKQFFSECAVNARNGWSLCGRVFLVDECDEVVNLTLRFGQQGVVSCDEFFGRHFFQ